MRIIILILVSFPISLCAQKAQKYLVVTQELSQKVIATPVEILPYRLAVVPFTASRISVQTSSQFGDYLTETIIGTLDGHPTKIKLFERTRLDAVLKEQEFSLTELMKPATALKLGQLVPIDVILSGTYTKLKSYVDVSARLMDVATGEILMSYNGRIKMDKNLAVLFKTTDRPGDAIHPSPEGTTQPVQVVIHNNNNNTITTAQPVRSKEEICKERASDFRKRLDDLSAPEKINALLHEAMKVPFDNLCGVIHYDMMYAFSRYKIVRPDYDQFLLHTLDTIAFPANDNRAYEMVRYLAWDQLISEEEWKSGLTAMKRVGNYSLSSYIAALITKSTSSTEVARKRLDEFMTLAIEGKVGLPVPLAFENIFLEVMEGVRANPMLGRYVYTRHASRLQLDDRQKASVFHELDRLYETETLAEGKTEVISWLADFFRQQKYEKAHEHLFEFVWQFQLTDYEDRNEKIGKDFPESDLKVLVDRCRELFAAYAQVTPYPSQKEDRIKFCVRYDVPIPGIIPTLPEAAAIFRGTNVDEQLRVIQLLSLMGERPKSIETEIIGLFNKRSIEHKQKLSKVQTIAIEVLGHTKTSQRTAIEYMIQTLTQYNEATEASEIALVSAGKPAVPYLISHLDKTTSQDGGMQYQLITILGKIGKPAALARPSIQRILKINQNKDVVYAAEAALQAME
jgi:TolB-like protein